MCILLSLIFFSFSLHLSIAGHLQSCIGPGHPTHPPLLPSDFCAEFSFKGRRGEAPAYVNITAEYSNSPFANTIITEFDQNPTVMCGPHVGMFALCLGYTDVEISDEWCKLCPQLVLRKTTFPPLDKTVPMPCVNLGDDHLDDIPAIVNGANAFAFDLLGTETLPNDMDAFVSPFSLVNSLVMPTMAARANTLAELLSTLHIDKPNIRWGEAFAVLAESLQHRDSAVETNVLNRLWLATSWVPLINPQVSDRYQRFGEIKSSDFMNGPEVETYIINHWVYEQTRGQISNALDSHNLSANTVSVFTTVLFFEAQWETPFFHFIVEEFTDNNGEFIEITMMQTDDVMLGVFQDDQVQVIEIPFAGEESELSMVIIRPSAEDIATTEHIEANMNKELLFQWLGNQVPTHFASFMLPQFEMFDIHDVTSVLKNLGIQDLFDPNRADLRNLTTAEYNVYEDAINRQDKLTVGANGIKMSSLSTDGVGHERTKNGPINHADRPFVFLIMDRSVNLILGAGRVTNPNGWRMEGGDAPNGPAEVAGVGGIIVLVICLVAVFYCGGMYLYNARSSGTQGVENIPHIASMRNFVNSIKNKYRNLTGDEASDDAMMPGDTGGYSVPRFGQGMYGEMEKNALREHEEL